MTLSASQVASLEVFEDLLRERAIPAGLIAEADAGRVRTRHVLDCLRAAVAVGDWDRDAYDLGSGAGLPGMVVAIARPMLSVGLVESRARRAAFLELAIERLGLANAHVLHGRIEDLVEPVAVCFARALASLPRAWELAEPRLRPGGRLVFFAGRQALIPERLAGRTLEVGPAPVLERGGPLVIMAR
ncbi:MAG TPA: RsmG family class I SAM-dependent methyltransferase [Actinomycetota bacterium]|nr:RsmG family class I SAM-dependent methyltransferase [Actinomycetota bacterium]